MLIESGGCEGAGRQDESQQQNNRGSYWKLLIDKLIKRKELSQMTGVGNSTAEKSRTPGSFTSTRATRVSICDT
jgi:hypothetical protein